MPTPINMIFKNLCADVSIKQHTDFRNTCPQQIIDLQICANAKFSWCCAMNIFFPHHKFTAQSSPITLSMRCNWRLFCALTGRFGLAPMAVPPRAWAQLKASRRKGIADPHILLSDVGWPLD